MRALCALIFVLIHAILPANEDVKDAAELLRVAAIKAGCPADRVRLSMRSLGGEKGLEVEVWCAP